jgi:hypothetical protein
VFEAQKECDFVFESDSTTADGIQGKDPQPIMMERIVAMVRVIM